MEQLSKDSPDKENNISLFFWEYLAPGFLIKIRERLRIARLRRYKRRKVKLHKLAEDAEYCMEFNIVIGDKNNSQTVGPFNIVIPAKGVYFAKQKLLRHIKEVVDIEVVDFDVMEQESVD